MAEVFDVADASQLLTGARTARQAISRGELVVIPTDTVYGVAADAFNPQAVERLLEAKGRTRQSPPPVLVADMNAVRALAESVPDEVQQLADAFWPGPLTIILPAQPSLAWDLGDTGGTVALRIPSDDVTLEILKETGPLAVSSANRHGEPAATTANEAEAMLGESVTAILDAGEAGTGVSSTIVDATNLDAGRLRILRQGAIGITDLMDVCHEVEVSLAPKRPTPQAEEVPVPEDPAPEQPSE